MGDLYGALAISSPTINCTIRQRQPLNVQKRSLPEGCDSMLLFLSFMSFNKVRQLNSRVF